MGSQNFKRGFHPRFLEVAGAKTYCDVFRHYRMGQARVCAVFYFCFQRLRQKIIHLSLQEQYHVDLFVLDQVFFGDIAVSIQLVR